MGGEDFSIFVGEICRPIDDYDKKIRVGSFSLRAIDANRFNLIRLEQ
jgi:hypothetical protein